MIRKTRGIVIHYIKYQDTSIIVKIFTEDFGLVPFIVNGIRSSKSKRSMGYFQPFSLLELVAYVKSGRDIQRLSEYKYLRMTPSITSDIKKSSIVLFLSEILGKVLHHEKGHQHELFEFLFQMVLLFDNIHEGIENFHLYFLIHLSPHLGIGISDSDGLLESMEVAFTDRGTMNLISRLLHADTDLAIHSSGNHRLKALELLIQYYEHHGISMGEIKSLKVLHQVFS